MRTKHSDGLTPAREIFCGEYVRNGSNAAAAYKVAFPRSLKWHPSTVYEHACLLKRAPAVKARIAELARAITEEAAIDAQAMLREAACIARSDITLLFDEFGELLPMADWPASMRAAVSSIEMIPEYRRNGERIGYRKKVRLWDKNAALDKIFRHMGLYEEDNKQRRSLLDDLNTTDLRLLRDALDVIAAEADAGAAGSATAAAAGSAERTTH